MIKEFVPYQESLELKELGFNEPCFGYYYNRELSFGARTSYGEVVEAPTFSQALRFFREKYGLDSSIQRRKEKVDDKWVKREFYSYFIENNEELPVSLGLNLKDDATYEQAELACLKKLIEIVKTNKS